MPPSRENRIENDRKARRMAKGFSPELELYTPPDDDACEIQEQELWLSAQNRIMLVMVLDNRRLVRFFVAWQTRDRDGDWTEKYSVCTKHGWLHEHTTGHHSPDDRKNRKPLYSQVDVQECYDEAYELVHGRYLETTGGR